MTKQIENQLENIFEEWVQENGQSLLNYIYKLVQHKQLSEDLYQEVLISSYLALPTFENRSNLKSWIYKIAINKCKDYWRKQKTVQKFWEEKVYFYESSSSIPLPEEAVINKCSEEEMIETINELPDIYREPLLLFYYKDQTLGEISETKKIPISTVKTRMRRAKVQLKERAEELVAL
ncbi:RNA polymerase sigma factor [Robertmurraya andreesenii]|uniref:RNA polymerase sigma-70 factor (ECF subfamily) n=1 Tax=Anoxybacillus andreesenii TaxID=1325932 RepID=A0ABT9V3M3_9BACL|nr:RNA polymerase sigma factor [Robertmurraya andreesenii]MDQ0155543.1 RNA polymerase sigma-70 factor (ECF subfamily) [Robertmurraya andreesenii]